MTDRPAKDPVEIPNKPFPSENEMAERSANVLKEQRKASGGLEDASNEGDMKVSDEKPYKGLRSS
jgi:hypothetical protein